MLKTYLFVLLKVMRGVCLWTKEMKTNKNFVKELDDVQQEHITPLMVQFTESEKDINDFHNIESVQHKDQIIAICILILVQIGLNKKTKFGKEKSDLDPPDKLKLILKIRENLDKNSILLNSSYLTLIMLAFRRDSLTRRENDVIPTITEVLEVIKQKEAVTNSVNQPIKTNNFDIEFYFLVLRNLYLYSKETKKYFLTHVLAFLDKNVSKILTVFNKKHNKKDQEQDAKNFFYEIVETCLA
jgi:hypothetical protein